MNFRKTLLAASIAALPLMMVGQALASAPIMAGPTALQSPQQGQALIAKLAATRATHGLDADHGFSITAQHPGVIGTRITRAAHTYKGVRVFQSESVVVTNDAGEIVSESISDRRSGLGQGSGNASLRARTAGFTVVPQIQNAAAIDLVIKKVSPNGVHQTPPSAELIIYPIVTTKRAPGALNKSEAQLNATDLVEEVSDYALAYLVKTRMLEGSKPVFYDTVISAADGSVIKQWRALQSVAGTGKSQYNGTIPLNTTLSGTTYSMKDPSRGTGGTYGMMAITNANHGTSAGSVYTNTTNDWGDGLQYNGGSTTNANGQTAAVNAMWGLMNTYDTLKNVLGWQSLDGNNTATYIAAHVNTNYDNAYYSDGCKCMFIGDGGSGFYSLGAIDVIGHEMGHGVTNATSDLTYSGESGGLNESNSDITGEMVEAYARAGGTGTVIPNTGNDWATGKEIAKSGNPLRYLYKPSLDGSSPNAWTSSIGNLDVHYSSGPNNRMFYFLSQGSNASSSSNYYSQYLVKSPAAMTGIGSDKAFRIWFKANTTKFTASTNYADARAKVIASAAELYGANSKEVIAVTRAYAAINVGADVDETPPPGGGVSISSQPSSVTVAAGSTATFSVTATGGTAPYKYQWMRNGANIAGATSATYSLTAQTADSGAVFTVKVTDSATSPTTATSSGATLTVGGGGGGTTERIVNGGFESSTTGWGGTTGAIGSFSGQSAYEGARFAWLGGNGTTATETLTQSVAIPAAATSASLSFALHIDTAETENVAYDKLVVTVKNSAGTVLGTLATYTNLNKASGYQIRTFNLLPYKGQTVTLSFAMREDSSLQTSFVVDKVSLLTQ
ncbi:M4 family metallopeptidase [Massilia antarctica]|uniref:M4 family metallopeptidase n=1 Tax=Massilia antarctica TaxID=2765360 RepID=A0AA48WHI1_9BURK|nr:M4 family metallopeptidase [Massilia antarctica]QPI51295.1 M4 family metallopeptidase [Massilia antarctica]